MKLVQDKYVVNRYIDSTHTTNSLDVVNKLDVLFVTFLSVIVMESNSHFFYYNNIINILEAFVHSRYFNSNLVVNRDLNFYLCRM